MNWDKRKENEKRERNVVTKKRVKKKEKIKRKKYYLDDILDANLDKKKTMKSENIINVSANNKINAWKREAKGENIVWPRELWIKNKRTSGRNIQHIGEKKTRKEGKKWRRNTK